MTERKVIPVTAEELANWVCLVMLFVLGELLVLLAWRITTMKRRETHIREKEQEGVIRIGDLPKDEPWTDN